MKCRIPEHMDGILDQLLFLVDTLRNTNSPPPQMLRKLLLEWVNVVSGQHAQH